MTDESGKAVSILVVDDDPVVLDLLFRPLRSEGYELFSATDGERALEVLSQNAIDIVISDVKMPKLNGLDLLRQIKEDYPGVGVIIMTAYGDTYTVKEALLLGADEYIAKPFKAVEVSMIVDRTYWRILANRRTTIAADTEGAC